MCMAFPPSEPLPENKVLKFDIRPRSDLELHLFRLVALHQKKLEDITLSYVNSLDEAEQADLLMEINERLGIRSL